MKLILYSFLISALIIAGAVLMVMLQLPDGHQVILHFDALKQPDFVGSRDSVVALLGTGGVMLIVNLFLARVFDRREHFVALILTNCSLLLSILLFIATSVIIANNK